MKKITKLLIILIYNLSIFIISYLLTTKILFLMTKSLEHIPNRIILTLSIFFVTYFYLMWQNLYSRNYHYYLKYTMKIVVKNMIFSITIALIFVVIFANIEHPKHFFTLLIYLITGAIAFSVIHSFEYLWIKYLSKLGYFKKNILVIGNPDERFLLQSYFQDIGNTKTYIGIINYKKDSWFWESKAKSCTKRLNDFSDVREIIINENIGEIIFFLGDGLQGDLLENIANYCRELAISYYLVPEIKRLPNKYPWNKPFPYIPVLEIFATNRDSLTNISIKRLIDIFISSISLVLFIPLGIIIALAIKMEGSGPVFYITTRIGKNGKPIRFYKFRTMIVNAEKEKQKLLKFNARKDGPLFKMKDDPRITKVGNILRKFSLDEVPQLFNVFLGNMSLIGPRPHLPEEVAEYTESDYLRLECMPGIVGLPQIHGRNTLGFKEWVDYDLNYRKNWTLALDFKIMFETIKIILSPFVKNGDHEYWNTRRT